MSGSVHYEVDVRSNLGPASRLPLTGWIYQCEGPHRLYVATVEGYDRDEVIRNASRCARGHRDTDTVRLDA